MGDANHFRGIMVLQKNVISVMKLTCVPCSIVSTCVKRNHSYIIDISFERSIHVYNQVSCLFAGLSSTKSTLCRSIHTGVCQPFQVVQATPVLPQSPQPSQINSADLTDAANTSCLTNIHSNVNLSDINGLHVIAENGVNNKKEIVTDDGVIHNIKPNDNFMQITTQVEKNVTTNSSNEYGFLPTIADNFEDELSRFHNTFANYGIIEVNEDSYAIIAEACNTPLYWKKPLALLALQQSANNQENESSLSCSVETLRTIWAQILKKSTDTASKFLHILTWGKNRDYLIAEDFVPMLQDIVSTHPGFLFLQSAPEFHMRYIQTVIARIYFSSNWSWTGKLTLNQLRKSDFLSVLESLDSMGDINAATNYFSYEHFYVIYCKFWELDTDHDLKIGKHDLIRHDNYAISHLMVERIFSGVVSTTSSCKTYMTYPEFVWFLMAEEDKHQPRSIEYWFRCMDLDGDGILSLYELEYFYNDQIRRLLELGIETVSFSDCACQILDMIQPKNEVAIRLSDLKRCKMVNVFFDTFFNLHKYFHNEQKDPFANLADLEEPYVSDWEKYASQMYAFLVAEECDIEICTADDDCKIINQNCKAIN